MRSRPAAAAAVRVSAPHRSQVYVRVARASDARAAATGRWGPQALRSRAAPRLDGAAPSGNYKRRASSQISGRSRDWIAARIACRWPTARRDGRGDVGCIVLGRGEDEAHVHTWLTTAAGVPGLSASPSDGRLFGISIAWREQQTSREAQQRRDRPAVSAVGRCLREGACFPTKVHSPMTIPNILALDFDGVLCDGMRSTSKPLAGPISRSGPPTPCLVRTSSQRFASTPASDHDRLGDAYHAAGDCQGTAHHGCSPGVGRRSVMRWSTMDRYRAPRW